MSPKVKAVYLDEELQKELQDRLSRIEGHIRGIKEMLTRRESCNDLLVQLAAVKAAINQATIKLLEGHMDRCVSLCLEEGDLDELRKFKKALALVLKRD